MFLSVFADPRRFRPDEFKARSLAMIDAIKSQTERHAEVLALASSAAEIPQIAATGKIAVLMGLEGGHTITDDLALLAQFHELGVRYMTLTWSNTHNWADSSSDEARHDGMTAFGYDVVREMNRLGMMIDVSHASDNTVRDVLEATAAPIIASHSSARALVDVPRNLSDDLLRAIAENGGLVMINFGGSMIDVRMSGTLRIIQHSILHVGIPPTPLDYLLNHIDHVVLVAGIDHVGLGSDFDGTLFMPEGLRDVAGFPNITAALQARGYSDDHIRKILEENLLHVFAKVESVARDAQRLGQGR